MYSSVHLLRGKSNITSFVEISGQRLVQKVYNEKLVEYDVLWPLTRKTVESFSHQKIAQLTKNNDYFNQPAIFHKYDSLTTLTMEYIEAPALYQIITEDRYAHILPDEEQLSHLIEFLNVVQGLRISDFSKEEQRFLESQAVITACMYHNKLNDMVPVLKNEPRYFCLGDVSLNNILFDGHRFTLLDFECSHMGYRGYDIGQLLGMSIAYSNKSDYSRNLSVSLNNALVHSNLSKKEQQEILSWSAQFQLYYSNMTKGTAKSKRVP